MPRKPNYDREALIDIARDVFWKQGWAGTSMKDLERALKLKPGSFYAAFGSKDALYSLALERYARDGMARLDVLEAELGALGALRHQPLLVVVDTAAQVRACMLAKTYVELRSKDHPLSEVAAAHLGKAEARFSALFAAAQRDGDIAARHDPKLLGQRYQSDLLGLRIMAERPDVDAAALAQRVADDLERWRD